MSFEKRMNALEVVCIERGQLPETSVSRTLLDARLAVKIGLLHHADECVEAVLAWAVSVGAMQQPKKIFYGLTIEEAMRRAEEHLLEQQG